MYGTRLWNSEFGLGAYKLEEFMMRIQCRNLMMVGVVSKTRHVGRQIPSDDERSRLTMELESLTLASEIRDGIAAFFKNGKIEKHQELIRKADEELLAGEREATFKRLDKAGLGEGELSRLNDVLTMNDEEAIPTGPLTRWKLGNAVSNLAGAVRAERALDLQKLAGEIIDGSFKLS